MPEPNGANHNLYPDTLPGPSQPLTFEPAERRQSVGRPGPWALRPYSRERIGTVRATFVLSQPEAAAFRLWWAQDITQGGAWFTAPWPNVYGNAVMAYCFAEPPQWEHQGRGIWRVTAALEYRPIYAAMTVDGLTTEDGLTLTTEDGTAISS